jgi:hypothetical protein
MQQSTYRRHCTTWKFTTARYCTIFTWKLYRNSQQLGIVQFSRENSQRLRENSQRLCENSQRLRNVPSGCNTKTCSRTWLFSTTVEYILVLVQVLLQVPVYCRRYNINRISYLYILYCVPIIHTSKHTPSPITQRKYYSTVPVPCTSTVLVLVDVWTWIVLDSSSRSIKSRRKQECGIHRAFTLNHTFPWRAR